MTDVKSKIQDSQVFSRLVFSRLLIREGVQYANRRQVPSAGVSVLNLQDGIEMALRAIAEYVGCSDIKESVSFDQLITSINSRDPQKTVPLRQAITRINKARVSFKHFGILPTDDDALDFSRQAEQFLSELVLRYVGIDALDLSEVELIDNPRARRGLAAAVRCKNVGDLETSVWWCARTFAAVFGAVGIKLPESGRTPYRIDVNDNYSTLSATEVGKRFAGHVKTLDERTIDLSERVDALVGHLALLERGIELSPFRRFCRIVPSAEMNSGGIIFVHTHTRRREILTAEDVQFAIDFSLQSILWARTDVRVVDAEYVGYRKLALRKKTDVHLSNGFQSKGQYFCTLEEGTAIFAERDQWDTRGLMRIRLDGEYCVVDYDAVDQSTIHQT